jgi:DNA (cytosine-5)-methyltransferase 1
MKFGSLFSGIGAFDLGFVWAGWEPVFQVEVDKFCRDILDIRFPDTEKFGDIKKVGIDDYWRLYKESKIEALVGGFPCQPVSLAGRQRALRDERWLWPQFRRFIIQLRPRYVVIENVYGLLHRGGVDILRDLAEGGYDAEWQTIKASAFGADHKRERVFIIAYPKGIGVERVWPEGVEIPQRFFEKELSVRDSNGQWKVEPDVRRVDDGVAYRVDRLKSLGNSVMPQIGYWLGALINEHVEK